MFKLTTILFASLLTLLSNGQAISSESSQSSLEHNDPLNASPYQASANSKHQEKRTIADRLVDKADEYFGKMWYAEAAALYDEILKDYPDQLSDALLQKAGDSHYFNSNMKMAFKWYDKLYAKHKSGLDHQNLFRYSHTLKGTGRYAKAKRIMNIIGLQNKAVSSNVSAYEAKLKALRKKQSIQIINLNSNSPFSDFAPMFFNQHDLVFASARDTSFLKTNRYKWNNQAYLDLYVGGVNEYGKVENIKKFPKKINTKYHEAAATFSPDGKVMYFTRNNYGKKLRRDKDGINHLKLYKSVLYNGKWSEAVELPFNSEHYSTGHPALSPDGKALYFVSDMPGGFGDTDIYVVDIREDGSFSRPRNLGRTINSDQKEMFPYVTKEKLYFSSNRAFGLGGLDVYAATYHNDLYEVATNLGEPINSNKDDFSYIVDEENQSGYFASNRKGGKGDDDIYSFRDISVESKILKSSVVGVVFEKMTGRVISDAVVQLMDSDNYVLFEGKSDEFGNFEFNDLAQNASYLLKAKKENYKEKTITLETEDMEEVSANLLLERVAKAPKAKEKDRYKLYEAQPIYFDFERYSLREISKNQLDDLAVALKDNPNMTIKIASHTDSRGSRAFNKWLSQERANATKEYLLTLGVRPAQIESAIGYGEEQPINECRDGVPCSRLAHQNNRRSEFIITNY